MDEFQHWQQQNFAWRSDHSFWLEEVQRWSRQTQRLIGLLHKLEHALPEHSIRLNQHVARINAYDAEIKRHECGLSPQCLKDCDSFIGSEEQRHFHQKLAGLHEIMQQQHADFSMQYGLQMQQFRDIVRQLIAEIDEDS